MSRNAKKERIAIHCKNRTHPLQKKNAPIAKKDRTEMVKKRNTPDLRKMNTPNLSSPKRRDKTLYLEFSILLQAKRLFNVTTKPMPHTKVKYQYVNVLSPSLPVSVTTSLLSP